MNACSPMVSDGIPGHCRICGRYTPSLLSTLCDEHDEVTDEHCSECGIALMLSESMFGGLCDHCHKVKIQRIIEKRRLAGISKTTKQPNQHSRGKKWTRK